MPLPNILSKGGLGPAYAHPEALAVLTALGLISGGYWTQEAEPVLWRVQPRAWQVEPTSDPRFAAAVRAAIETMPGDVRTQIEQLVIISETDVDAEMARYAAAMEETRARFGPKARTGRSMTPAVARQSLAFVRRNQLDWIFFRRWRMPDGWLTGDEIDRALDVFHDRQALQIRRAVLEQLYPDRPEVAE